MILISKTDKCRTLEVRLIRSGLHDNAGNTLYHTEFHISITSIDDYLYDIAVICKHIMIYFFTENIFFYDHKKHAFSFVAIRIVILRHDHIDTFELVLHIIRNIKRIHNAAVSALHQITHSLRTVIKIHIALRDSKLHTRDLDIP